MSDKGLAGRRPTIAVQAKDRGGFGAIRWSTHDFDSEWTRLLQQRLWVFARFLAAAAWALYLLNVLDYLMSHEPGFGFLREEPSLFAGCLVATAMVLLLRRESMPRRGLEILDAGMLYVVFGVLLSDYCFNYQQGGARAEYYLALFIVLRGVVVPSRVLRTVLVSLPGPLAILAAQVVRARWGDPVPGTLPDWAGQGAFTAPWWKTVAWHQVYLYLAVAIAALSSYVSFALRRKAHEARQLDRYVLEERIGEGAMGEVYRAHHALMLRPVAIKFLRAEIAGERTIRRFEQEVRQTSRLTHPNSIAIYDYGQTEDGVFYYAMELLDGADLERIVEATGPMPAGRVIHVLDQACGALSEAHAKGLVHRDLKPSNLVLCEHGLELDVLKVVDFGLAKNLEASSGSMTEAGDIVGTPHTIAPEGLRGYAIGPRADLYALAAVGCHLLSGKPIFDARTAAEFIVAHLESEPVRPSSRVPTVPADLESVLLRSLAKEPEERHESAMAFRKALLACRDAGTWTQVDAVRWWAEHQALRPVRPPDGTPRG